MNELMESAPRPTPKFTAIWQSGDRGRDWPLFNWLMRIFEPYISSHIFDGERQVAMDNAILFNTWVYANDPDYYAKFRGKNAFLVHIGDEFYELGVDRYVHFRGVFRMIWSSVFNPRFVMTLPLGTFIKESPTSIAPVSERRYAWSFIGDAGKVSRPEMVRAMSPIEPHFCFSSTPIRGTIFYDRNRLGNRRISRPEFYQTLGQSVFAPSPMGNASLEIPPPLRCSRGWSHTNRRTAPDARLLQAITGRAPAPDCQLMGGRSAASERTLEGSGETQHLADSLHAMVGQVPI